MGPKEEPHLREKAEAIMVALATDDEATNALYERLRELRPEAQPINVQETVRDSVERHGMPATSDALGIHELYVRQIIDQSAFPSVVILARMRLSKLRELDSKREG
jgi:hypothetical protein